MLRRAEQRHGNAAQVLRLGDALQHLHAVDRHHADVEQYEIRQGMVAPLVEAAAPEEIVEPLPCADRDARLVARAMRADGIECAVELAAVVVHDQDPRSALRRFHGCSPVGELPVCERGPAKSFRGA